MKFFELPTELIEELQAEELVSVKGGIDDTFLPDTADGSCGAANNASGNFQGPNNKDGICSGANNGSGACQGTNNKNGRCHYVNNGNGLCALYPNP